MKKLIFATALAVLSTLAVACSGDDSGGTQTATKTAASVTSAPASSPAAGTSVDVILQEWSVIPAVSSAPAGDVTFNLSNVGPNDEHEFVILKTDLTADQLPLGADGAVDEEGAGITSPGEVEGVGVGAQVSKTFTLTPGHYVLICNIVDDSSGQAEVHFAKGMQTEFTVQ